MSILIDIYGGDLHEKLIGHHEPKTYAEAQEIIKEALETGFLLSVIHSDFMPTAEKAAQSNALVLKGLLAAAREQKL